MKYVIIGNSAAAVGCVEGIRSLDKEGEITLLASEPHHTYSRPLISYLLQGKTDRQRMKYRPDSFYTENAVDARLGVTVRAIYPVKKTVITESGEAIPYDRLLVATGSCPFVPPMEGLDTVEKKFSFMTLDDALALEQALTPETRVLIVGAGLIGLKCAEGILHRVASVQVVDLAGRILPSILDEQGSALVQKHIENAGLRLSLGTTVRSFEGNIAHLTDGTDCAFDVLVVAVGVRPNAALVKDAGGDVDRGILVDENGATSLPDVYAAGDCAQGYDASTGEKRVLALLPNAYMQGEAAGIAMAGGEKPFSTAVPMNAMGLFGLHMVTAGVYGGEETVFEENDTYKKLCCKDDRLTGYILIGDIARAGIYTALVRERTPLSTLDFDLIKTRPQLMAFSAEARKEKLGGAPHAN